MDRLAALAAALGFGACPVALDARARTSLGLADEVEEARLVQGVGALRALLVAGAGEVPVRALLSTVAVALAKRTAHVLWIVLAVDGDRREAGVACWPEHPRAPRLRALVVRRRHVVASDAETICALDACAGDDDLLVHARWCEVLGRDALSRRFYRTLEQRVNAMAASLLGVPAADRAQLALLCASRLIFLGFLQSKGWLDGDRAFLSRRFDECMASGGRFHGRVLLPLFFGTLNTPSRQRAPAAQRFGAVPFLNGGLFARTALERRHSRARFSDEVLGALFAQLLDAFRFTAREDQEHLSEAAIDPEMLGRAFESLMAAGERRTSGAFYTPHALVAHVSERALLAALGTRGMPPEALTGALHGTPLPADAAEVIRRRLRSFTVLDPACGSGAFLVYVLERLADLHRAAGDTRDTAAIRRDVLCRAIHGVDVNPTAVWLCELRLWLSVVIESDEHHVSRVPPLPNLDCNIRVGDALSGDAFTQSALSPRPVTVTRLRERYARAAGARKLPLRRALALEERRRALVDLEGQLRTVAAARRERLTAARSPDLFGNLTATPREWPAQSRALRLRGMALRREIRRIEQGGALPFSFASHFGHVHAAGGFGLVIGNPPWVRLKNIPLASRAGLRERYRVFRDAGWNPSLDGAVSRPFGAQADLSAIFVERSVTLTVSTGIVALLVPAKLWRSLAGGGVRRLLASDTEPLACEDWSEAPSSFGAAVYPSVLLAARRSSAPSGATCLTSASMRCSVRRRSLHLEWDVSATALRLRAGDAASPWLLHPPQVRAAFDLLAARGIPLGALPFGRPTLGVKSGCNEAFIVTVPAVQRHDGSALAAVEYRGRRARVERALLRPLLRGETVTAWRSEAPGDAILWTHDELGAPLRTLPPGAAHWLAPWRRRLSARADLRGASAWWTLFRTDAADRARTRVVWSDFGRTPRATLLDAGDPTVPLNSCYVIAFDVRVDALTLMALLNSALVSAWLNAIAEPARGGWHRYLAWTVSLLPLPVDWPRAREILAPLAEQALRGDAPSAEALLDGACRAYRVRRTDMDPLVAWCH